MLELCLVVSLGYIPNVIRSDLSGRIVRTAVRLVLRRGDFIRKQTSNFTRAFTVILVVLAFGYPTPGMA